MAGIRAARELKDRTVLAKELYPGKVCVEIGVFGGDHAAVMLAAGPSKLILVDPWHVQDKKVYAEMYDWKGHRGLDERQLAARLEQAYLKVVRAFGRDTRVEIVRELSLDAATRFHVASLDVVYIDGNHAAAACAAI